MTHKPGYRYVLGLGSRAVMRGTVQGVEYARGDGKRTFRPLLPK